MEQDVWVEEQREVPGSSHTSEGPTQCQGHWAGKLLQAITGVTAGWAVICLEGLLIFPLFWKVAASEELDFLG